MAFQAGRPGSPSKLSLTAPARWVGELDAYERPGSPTESVGSFQSNSCLASFAPLTVIPEDMTIEVAPTPSIPEEEEWAPASASASVRRSPSPGPSRAKDWTMIETKLERFAHDLEASTWPGSCKRSVEELLQGSPAL